MAENDDQRNIKLSRIEVGRVTELKLELDDEKVAAIQACLAKGQLTIRMNDVDLTRSGKLSAPYLYD